MTPADRRAALSLPHRVRAGVAAAGDPVSPLLLLLHGRGGNELAMAALADAFDRRFLVISPRAPLELEPFAYQWFPEEFTDAGPRVGGPELDAAVGTLTAFIDEAVAAYGTDPVQTYLAGFSQGGTIALAATIAAPERVAGAVSMSGWLPSTDVASGERRHLSGKPVLLVHGSDDLTIGPRFGRLAHAALGELGLAAEHRELSIGHTTTPESIGAVAAWLTARLDDGARGG